MAEMRTENQQLTQQLDAARADHRAQDEKIRDLEHQLALAKETTVQETPVPQLPVEVVAPASAAAQAQAQAALPPGDRIVGTADDGTEIVYEGDAAAGKAATLDDDSGAARAMPRDDDAAALPSTDRRAHHTFARAMHAHVRDTAAPAADDGAVNEYQAAVALLKDGHQADAITALRAFLQHYPRHDYADNAQYWIGEAYYAQHDYQHALAEFRATIEVYPRGNKVPDALLKVGYCYQALGQAEKAKAVLEQVVNLYPKSGPAALAAKRLETP